MIKEKLTQYIEYTIKENWDINAFADIERHGVTFAMKQIHPWSGG